MTQIMLNSEQISLFNQAIGPIVLVDGAGRELGKVVSESSSTHDFTSEMEDWDRAVEQDFKTFMSGSEIQE